MPEQGWRRSSFIKRISRRRGNDVKKASMQDQVGGLDSVDETRLQLSAMVIFGRRRH